MSTILTIERTSLRRAAVRGILAPSVLNVQPWRFELFDGRLEIWFDRSRRLPYIDPVGRQRAMSVGCALFNARAVLAAAGVPIDLARFPDAERPELVAQLLAGESIVGEVEPIAELDAWIENRQTGRDNFEDVNVSFEFLSRLVAAARAEGAELIICGAQERAAISEAADIAEQIRRNDVAAVAELLAWVSSGGARSDGIARDDATLLAARYGAESMEGRISVPRSVRPATAERAEQCVLVLGTETNDRVAWVRAGEALERVLLEATRAGLATALPSESLEMLESRAHITQRTEGRRSAPSSDHPTGHRTASKPSSASQSGRGSR